MIELKTICDKRSYSKIKWEEVYMMCALFPNLYLMFVPYMCFGSSFFVTRTSFVFLFQTKVSTCKVFAFIFNVTIHNTYICVCVCVCIYVIGKIPSVISLKLPISQRPSNTAYDKIVLRCVKSQFLFPMRQYLPNWSV